MVVCCHTGAFWALGKSKRELLYYHIKTVVTVGDDTGGIIYNRSMIDLAHHYGLYPWGLSHLPLWSNFGRFWF